MNSITTAWISIFIAGAFELVWVVGMKYSQSFTRLTPSIICVIGMVGSFVFLMYAIKYIPIGTAYALWVGIGVVAITLYGIIFFNEPATLGRIICIMFILIGTVGLRLTSINET